MNKRKLLVRLALIFGALFGLPLLLLFAALFIERGSSVVLDNGNDFPVAVAIDGKDAATIAPHQHKRVSSKAGAHTLVARGPSGVVDEGTFTIPQPKGALDGFRAVYNLGGAARYVLVSICYGGSNCDQGVERIGEGKRFFELPKVLYGELDGEIPETTAGSGVQSHLFFCHAGATRKQFACPIEKSLLAKLGLR